LEDIARRRGLRLIYDGAHAFGARLRDRALLDYGDAAGVSFHATKPFHCVEGGGIVTHDPAHAEKISLMRGHGLRGDDIVLAGTNARISEFHSAMGLAVLPHVEAMIAQRQDRFEAYREQLEVLPVRLIEPEAIQDFTWNYAYFPVIFETEQVALAVRHALAEDGIEGRRYFWPSLSRLDHIEASACPIAEDLASRVLCLPFGQWITQAQIDRVSMIVADTLTG
jgi:dTDP-4-amino-4,6-dideoxygalactose transaminase